MGQHGEKMVCVRGVPGVTETLGKPNSHFNPTQTGLGPHHHVEAAVDWCSSSLLVLHVYTTTEICCCLPDPFQGMGAWRKTMEPQKPANSPGSGPEVVKRQRELPKSERRKESVAGQCRMR